MHSSTLFHYKNAFETNRASKGTGIFIQTDCPPCICPLATIHGLLLVALICGVRAFAANADAYPAWSSWSDWSGCSCFNKKSVRRRFCRVFDPQILGFCLGSALDERGCEPEPDCSKSVEALLLSRSGRNGAFCLFK